MLVYQTTNSFIALGKLVKTRGVHNKIKFRSLKNQAFDAYKSAQTEINFPNYKYFEDVNRAYADFFQKLMSH